MSNKPPASIPPVVLRLNAVSFQLPQPQAKSQISLSIGVDEGYFDLPAVSGSADGRYDWGYVSSDGLLVFGMRPGMYHITVQATIHKNSYFGRSTVESAVVTVDLEQLISSNSDVNVPIEDASTIGLLTMDICPSTDPDVATSMDLSRSSRIPLLEHLRGLIKLLPALEKAVKVAADPQCTRSYNTLRAFSEPLWILWRVELPALLLQHSTKSVKRDDELVISIIAAQDNVLEDTVLQAYRQLAVLADILRVRSSSPITLSAKQREFLKSILHYAAISVILVYQWSDTHPDTTWTGMEQYASKESMTTARNSKFNNGLANFDRLHTLFIKASYELQRMTGFPELPQLPEDSGTMISFLCQNALRESRTRVDLGPYTRVFECLVGPYAEAAYQIIETDFQACKTVEDRDSVRRLITHLVQQSSRLPRSLLLSDVELYSPDGGAPHPVAGGAFGDVYRGLRGSQLVAVKQLRISTGVANFQMRIKQWYLEIMTCRTMEHPNVLPICGIPGNMRGLTLVTPWLQHGTVHEYIEVKSLQFAAQPVKLLHKLMVDIAQGMAYLHSEGLAHGDLRGANILVDDDDNARLTDFGLAVFVHGHSKNYASVRTGSLQWEAPEMINASGEGMTTRPTFATDVYSFSHVCIELFSGTSPYPELDNGNTTATGSFSLAVTRAVNPLRPSQPAGMPEGIFNLLQHYWAPSASARPSAAAVVQSLVNLAV